MLMNLCLKRLVTQRFNKTLAGINPKGEKITAMQRFVHAVKNFLRSLIGMDTKSLGSALDSTDYMLEGYCARTRLRVN
jgi:hypothetical protein